MGNIMSVQIQDPTIVLVPREPEDPAPQQIYLAMDEGEPYTVKELWEQFPDAPRWTIRDRLEQLVEDGFLQKKKHTQQRASYWIDL